MPNDKGGRRFKKAEVDEVYREWIREQPCLVRPFHSCLGVVQATHVTSRGAGGGDRKNLLPLCARGHSEQHAVGIRSFATIYRVDLVTEAARYWREYAGPFARIAELDGE